MDRGDWGDVQGVSWVNVEPKRKFVKRKVNHFFYFLIFVPLYLIFRLCFAFILCYKVFYFRNIISFPIYTFFEYILICVYVSILKTHKGLFSPFLYACT